MGFCSCCRRNDDDAKNNSEKHKSRGLVSHHETHKSCFNFVTYWFVKHPGLCCIFWFILYPAIFVPALFLGCWPMLIAADLKTYIRSDEEASVVVDALTIAKQLQGKDPVGSRRRLFNVDDFAFESFDDLSEQEVQYLRSVIKDNNVISDEMDEIDEKTNRNLQSSSPRVYKQKSWYTSSYGLHLFYLTKDGKNIFTSEHLETIKSIEKKLITSKNFEKYCAAPGATEKASYEYIGKSTPTCATMIPECDSVLNYFYAEELPTTGNITASLLLNGQGNLRNVEKVINDMIADDIIYYADRFFSQVKTSNMTRSSFNFGVPFTGYSTIDKTTWEAQKADFQTWITATLYPTLGTLSTDKIRVVWYQNDLALHEVNLAVMHDSYIAAGSFLFVFMYMWVQLRSFWLASVGMIGIIYSFPLTYITSYLVFNYKSMMLLNFLSLFIIVGIGADDVFVFSDLFEQSATLVDSEGKRMEMIDRFRWALHKGFLAMFLTSFTTAASFFSNIASGIVPIREFGTFMGLIVSYNFIIVMTLYPAAFLFYEYGLWSFRGYEDLNQKAELAIHATPGVSLDPKAQSPGNRNGKFLKRGSFAESTRIIGGLAKQGSFVDAFKGVGELLSSDPSARRVRVAKRELKEYRAGITAHKAHGDDTVEESRSMGDKIFEKIGSGGSFRNLLSVESTGSPKSATVGATFEAPIISGSSSIPPAKIERFMKSASSATPVSEDVAIQYIERANGNVVDALDAFFKDAAKGVSSNEEKKEGHAAISPKLPNETTSPKPMGKISKTIHYFISPKELNDHKLTKDGGFSFSERFLYNDLSPFLRRYRGPCILFWLILSALGISTLFWALKISDGLPDFFDENSNYGIVLEVFKEFQYTARDTSESVSTPPIINECAEGSDGFSCTDQTCPGKVSDGVYCNGADHGICCDPLDAQPACSGRVPYSCLCNAGYSQLDNCEALLDVEVTLFVVGCPCQTQNSKDAFIASLAAEYDVDPSQITVDCVIGPCSRRMLDTETTPRRRLAASQITITITPQTSTQYSSASQINGNSNVGGNVGGYVVTTGAPTSTPTTQAPTSKSPTISPNSAPTTHSPTGVPTTKAPTGIPTLAPTTRSPTLPTDSPTGVPTTKAPTGVPTTKGPTNLPTTQGPSRSPTQSPSKLPTTPAPTNLPTVKPSSPPTTGTPTKAPVTSSPSVGATPQPTKNPTTPTNSPTISPSKSPTTKPSKSPTDKPTTKPSKAPTTKSPTASPTTKPTKKPSVSPTKNPTAPPTTGTPTTSPTTKSPTTSTPSKSPTSKPTKSPTIKPTKSPTKNPTKSPSSKPSKSPTKNPTNNPTIPAPTGVPTTRKPTTLAPTTPAPTLNCENGGNFVGLACNCTEGWGGATCETKTCVGYPLNECSGHGVCDEGLCDCNENYSGSDCSIFTEAELADSETILITGSYGIKGLDRSQASADYPNGLPIYDETFDPTSEEGQKSMLRACAAFCIEGALRAKDACAEAPFTHLRKSTADETRYFGTPILLDTKTKESLMVRRVDKCPFADFVNYIETTKAYHAFPFPQDKVLEYLDEFLTEKTTYEKNGYIIRDYRDKSRRRLATYERILILTFQVQTGVDKAVSAADGYAFYSIFQAYFAKINKVAPKSTAALYQTSSEWARSVTEKGAIDGTVSSGILSIGFAFGSILLFTGNVLISLYTTLAIICIISSLMGFMFFVMGWTFGVIEAISITVFVGFSVDYCLHLGHAYEESDPEHTSYQRGRDAITQMGFSLIGGAGTTVGASIFLFFCDLVVFRRFGYVICVNTALSLLYAFFFFTPLLMALGPVRQWGEVMRLFDPCCRERRKRQIEKAKEEAKLWTKAEEN